MSTERLQKRADVAALYQQGLQALAFEIRVAMQAIASNSLPTLEASVAKQETLCATLLKLAGRLEQELGSSELPESRGSFPDGAFPAGAVEQRAVATCRAVYELNTQYASLLKHSGRSIALLSSLCRSRAGHFPEARRSPVKRQTWSCEV